MKRRLFGIFLCLAFSGFLVSEGCKDKDDKKCGNGRVGTGEQCDCGTDPNNLPPGCTDVNGGPDANCSTSCVRVSLETGSLCDNGVDDDEDGATDCDDNGCETYFRCVGEICTNRMDDDGNGLTDCEDPACVNDIVCEPEDCTNGVDDDEDGHEDCQDDECIGHADCAGVELCWNHIDDNNDGLTDCEESTCTGDFACINEESPANPGFCTDGEDNDLDGWTDCGDPGCVGSDDCVGSTCQEDATVALTSLGDFDQISLDVSDDPTGGELAEPCGIAAGKEKVVEIQMAVDGRLTVGYRQQGRHRYGLYFPAGPLAECTDALFACRTPTGAEEDAGLLDFGTRNAGTVYLVVAEAGPGEAAQVDLSISLTDPAGGEICGNWADDDNDGQIDCGDLDCRELPPDTTTPFLGCNDSACDPDVDLVTIPMGGFVKTPTYDVRNYDFGHSLPCMGAGSEDMVIGFTLEQPTQDATLVIGYDQSMDNGGDHWLGLFFRGGPGTGCDEALHGCIDTGGAGHGVAYFSAMPPGQYYLIVKGRAGLAGNISLTVAYTEDSLEICDDGVDDNANCSGDTNNDGQECTCNSRADPECDEGVDCGDTGCAQWESCIVEQCGDGVDNDFDGLTDCQDATDLEDNCDCTYACNHDASGFPQGVCEGGQTGQATSLESEVKYLGVCDITGVLSNNQWIGSIDASNWYGAGLPARNDYDECQEVNHGGYPPTPDVVVYLRVLDPNFDIVFEFDNRVQGIYYVADVYTADHCAACNAGTRFTPCNRRSQNIFSTSGIWYLLDADPGDYAFIIAPDRDFEYNNSLALPQGGPMDYTITCVPRP